MSGVKIAEVKFQPDFCVEIDLTNGHRIIYNLQPKLVTARFKGIDDWNCFCEGEIIDGSRIVWNDSMELSLDEILNSIGRK